MDLEEIEKVLHLSEAEKAEFQNNYFEYEEEVMELINLYTKHKEMSQTKNDLHARMARCSYDIYETWMELHKNAISLSSYRAEANLRGITMEYNFSRKMNEIIDKYLLIEKFV